ncbi:MAG: ribonuclease H-like domain-containing protein [Candidatus Jordarchaeaceae archaeon]
MKHSWGNVLEQERAKEILTNFFDSRRVPHAFIFFGPDGVGKFFTALQYSQMLYSYYSDEIRTIAQKKIQELQEPYVKLIFPLPRAKGESSDDSSIEKLSKEQIIWLAEHYCKHGMPYLEHYNCFLRDIEEGKIKEYEERMGFLDIETTGFFADYDYMLSYAIKDRKTGKVFGRVLTPKEIKTGVFDKKLIEDFVKDIRQFDRIVVYNGTDYRFAIPFARTRALRWGIDFPSYREIYVNDGDGTVRQKLRLSRKKLGNVCGLLNIPAKEHAGNPNIWLLAGIGDREALKYVFEHNVEDVESLAQLYDRLEKFMLIGKRSI